MLENLPISREEAKLLNSKSYFTGKVCINNHLDKRYTNTGICYSCKRNQMDRDYEKHKERVLNISKKSILKHKVKRSEEVKKWTINNRERSNQIKKNYKVRNRDKYLESCRIYQSNKRKDPFFRFSRNISKEMWEFMKGNKNRKSWKTFFTYTFEDLIKIIESKFNNNMTWNNYGTYWELDHIKPLDYFNKLNLSVNEKLLLAWNLSNLQPLEISKNRSKRNKY